jgi:hypothetical protein
MKVLLKLKIADLLVESEEDDCSSDNSNEYRVQEKNSSDNDIEVDGDKESDESNDIGDQGYDSSLGH